MGLTVWDQVDDYFQYSSLEGNFQTIDGHDHSSGKGVQIGTPGIQTGAITQPLIANGAIGAAQLGTDSVGTTNIQPDAVTNAELAAGSVYGGVIPEQAITYPMLAQFVIPLGTVVMWWQPSGGIPGYAPFPYSSGNSAWELMDGRPWSTISNDLGLSTGNIPDMRGVFCFGADIYGEIGPIPGGVGGNNSINLYHQHNVFGHIHGFGNHTHGISNDGGHYHTWDGGKAAYARTNCLPQNMTVEGSDDQLHTNIYHSLYINGYADNGSVINAHQDMDQSGTHDHGGATGAGGAGDTDEGTPHTTDYQLSDDIDIIPEYVAMLFLMRVRNG